MGGDDEFIALSPFGPWTADIDLDSNKDIDFAKLTDVSLEFKLKYMPKF